MTGRLFSIAGRRVLVTGASRGLGRTIARGLARNEARVVLAARSKDALEEVAATIQRDGGTCLVVPADLSDPEQIAAIFTRMDDELGGIDVLINNAGMNIRRAALETDRATWDRILRLNLDAAFLCAQHAARRMIAAGDGGRIVNIGSVAGLVALPTGTAYAVSKAALAQMTRSLASEWGPHGITVNCVAPWYFRTPLTEPILADATYRDEVLRITPLRRIGEDDDLVGTVQYLASPAAAYVTGQTIALDGGMSTSNLHVTLPVPGATSGTSS